MGIDFPPGFEFIAPARVRMIELVGSDLNPPEACRFARLKAVAMQGGPDLLQWDRKKGFLENRLNDFRELGLNRVKMNLIAWNEKWSKKGQSD